MTTPSNLKNADHLIHLILNRNEDVPQFSLLLGSGASISSGIKTAQEMIDEWRNLLFLRSNSSVACQDWLDDQSWYKHEDEYSLLFENIYDQPSQRRVYVEERIKDAHPNWGYIYLTNLLANRFFDVVFTTNFDDLINEACYLYSEDMRPIVAAHDSAVQGIRVTAKRPKIIKLHGDFLYDNIKNTLAELETLEANTKRKLTQFAREYGLVVLGYSGRDRSVMDTLELLLRDEENFRQGVYWCMRPGTVVSGRLDSLLRRDRVYLVGVDGFDEFMAELHKAVPLPLPKPIALPFEVATDRANRFVEADNPLRSHPVIGAHVEEVRRSIDRPRIPLQITAAVLSSMGEHDRALQTLEQAYEEDPTNPPIAHQYATTLAVTGRFDELAEFIPNSPIPVHNKTYFLLRAGQDQEVVDLASKNLDQSIATKGGDSDAREFTRINRAIALKRLGRADEMNADLDFLEQNGDTADPNIRAGVAALRGDKEEMLVTLEGSLFKIISPEELRTFPVFEDYQDDPDFAKLARSVEEN